MILHNMLGELFATLSKILAKIYHTVALFPVVFLCSKFNFTLCRGQDKKFPQRMATYLEQ